MSTPHVHRSDRVILTTIRKNSVSPGRYLRYSPINIEKRILYIAATFGIHRHRTALVDPHLPASRREQFIQDRAIFLLPRCCLPTMTG